MEKKVDRLGRIIIPLEFRTALHLNDNELVDLKIEGDSLIITKKRTEPKDSRRTERVYLDSKRKKRIEDIKASYKPGTAVKLHSIATDKDLIPVGMVGLVKEVDNLGTIFIAWKNGIDLAILDIPDDIIEPISTKEYNNYKLK